MKTFKDLKGREWKISLNVKAMKDIRSTLAIDLINVISLDKKGEVKVDLIDQIVNDPCLLVDVLWVLVEDEAKKNNISDIEFGSTLAGDAIEKATSAFLDELVDFFPGAKRLFLKKAVELSRKYQGEMTGLLEKALNDPQVEMRIRESMNLSTQSPGSAQ